MRGISIISLISIILFAVLLAYSRVSQKSSNPPKADVDKTVLGQTKEILSTPTPSASQRHFSEVVQLPKNTTGPTQTKATTWQLSSSPSAVSYTIAVVDAPQNPIQGSVTTFTWYVTGPSKIINTSIIYFGTTSTPGTLTTSVAPTNTRYSDQLNDFLQGEYLLPIRFVGNTTIEYTGKFYYRAYAIIDGKHYWSEEKSFIVRPLPSHEVIISTYPSTVPIGSNASFTWDVSGPSTTTAFTVIVGGKQSKSGVLDSSVELAKTPYTILVSDFTNGTYDVPLRFIGNTSFTETGTYYFRALAIMNDKNIWSSEYSLIVQ